MVYGMFKAIPTRYRNVQFRSRLEARWAAFFDGVGWPWQYEPIDLDGWIPDFRLCGNLPALVEIKPIDFSMYNDARVAVCCVEEVAPNVMNICNRMQDERQQPDLHFQHSFPQLMQHEIIVLGLGPWRNGSIWPADQLGLFLCSHWGGDIGGEDWAVLHGGYTPHKLDYAAEQGFFGYRIGGQYDGDGHLLTLSDDAVEYYWREAGNIVQWNARA